MQFYFLMRGIISCRGYFFELSGIAYQKELLFYKDWEILHRTFERKSC